MTLPTARAFFSDRFGLDEKSRAKAEIFSR